MFDLFENADMLKGLSDVEALHKLEKPSVFRIKGKDSSKAVLVSCLVHGCEPAGFRAFLKEINSLPEYCFDVYFFVGNVASAKIEPFFTNRLVPGKQNFNRIWVENPKTEEEMIGNEVFNYIKNLPLVAHLDLHSFTATDTNPHGFTFTEESLDMMKKMVPFIFFADLPLGSMIERTLKLCPSFVIECGTNNSKEADAFAFDSLQRFFSFTNLKNITVSKVDCRGVFTGMVNVKVKDGFKVKWSSKKEESDVTLREDATKLNLKKTPAGEFMGWADSLDMFKVKDKTGDVTPDSVLELKDGKLYTKINSVPALLAANEKIIKESGFYFFTRELK